MTLGNSVETLGGSFVDSLRLKKKKKDSQADLKPLWSLESINLSY